MKKRKYLIFILLGGMLVFISCMSAKPVEQSAQMRYEIDRWLCGILIDGYETLPEARQEAAAVNLDFWVRKTAHGIEYCALGILLFLAAGFLVRKQKKRCAAAFLTGAAFAALDEFHQYFVPGRSCNAVGIASSTNMFHAENTSRIRQKSSNFPFGMQTMSEYPKTTG